MNKEEISALIGHEIFAELEIQAANNGMTKAFELHDRLMIAVATLSATRVTNILIERGIILVK